MAPGGRDSRLSQRQDDEEQVIYEEEEIFSPSVLFSQNIPFHYDHDQILADPNLKRINEIRK